MCCFFSKIVRIFHFFCEFYSFLSQNVMISLRNLRKTQEQKIARDDHASFRKMAIETWQSGGLSVRQFLRAGGVSEPSFYSWRKRLLQPASTNGRADDLVNTLTNATLKDRRTLLPTEAIQRDRFIKNLAIRYFSPAITSAILRM